MVYSSKQSTEQAYSTIRLIEKNAFHLHLHACPRQLTPSPQAASVGAKVQDIYHHARRAFPISDGYAPGIEKLSIPDVDMAFASMLPVCCLPHIWNLYKQRFRCYWN
jgi:hypothetical protein